MVNFKNIILTFLILVCIVIINGQKINSIKIYDHNKLINSIKVNSNNTKTLIKDIVISSIEEGYITTNVDSSHVSNKILHLYLNKGEAIVYNEVNIIYPQETNLELIDNFRSKNKFFNAIDFNIKINEWISQMNNKGFPFAEIEFENSIINEFKIQIECHLKNGPFVEIDSLIIPETNKKEWNLISNVIKIKRAEPFNLSLIKDISNKLKNTVFIDEIKSSAYEFTDDQATIYVYAKPISKNSLNGLIGIQPSENGNIQFTGNVSLNFINSLNYGEQLKMNWRRMFNASQNLITEIRVPFLFNSNFEINGYVNMIKKDSSFFNFDGKTSLNYLVKNNFSVGVLLSHFNSTNLLENNYNSTTTNSFGFTFSFSKLNNVNNPSNGILFKSDLAYGWKETYNIDSANNQFIKTPNFNMNLKIDKYFKLKNRSTFKIGLNGSTMQNEILFENEFSRIGGFKTIRGFDEESISVSSFLISNLEWRFLLEENSNLFIFSDFAWTESKTQFSKFLQNYQSFGIGANIATPSGVLSLIYGLGRKVENSFLLRTGKIHLGFTSFF